MVGTLFPDDFLLGVSTNYVFNLTENGTSGNLELNFDVLSSIPDDLILSLGSENEVKQYLLKRIVNVRIWWREMNWMNYLVQ